MPLIEGWFDACCEPRNPGGHVGWGALLKIDRKQVWTGSGYFSATSEMSNNFGEYSAALGLLNEICRRQSSGLDGPVVIRGDSKLVIMQLSRKWKVHGGLYVPMYEQAKRKLAMVSMLCGGQIRLEWIPRERNNECDVLSKRELLARNIQFKIQPIEG
jgi:ribonuclease HI